MLRLAASPTPRHRNAPLHEVQTRRLATTSPHRRDGREGEHPLACGKVVRALTGLLSQVRLGEEW